MTKINLYYFSKNSFEHEDTKTQRHEDTKENLHRAFMSSCLRVHEII